MFGIIIGAGLLGLIIVVMEEGDFPGWFAMVLCVFAAVIPAAIVNAFLPQELFPVGLAVGAVMAGLAISALCGMTVKRASIAAGIYLVLHTALTFGLQLMLQE